MRSQRAHGRPMVVGNLSEASSITEDVTFFVDERVASVRNL